MNYYLAPALATLLAETNSRYPKRDHASDGWIGDAAHQAESYSDHNPDWNSQPPGVVRALDIDAGPDGDPNHDLRLDVLKATIGDPRVWYVISNGRIYSRTYSWAAHVYTGSDPHISHVHVSLQGHNGLTETAAHGIAYDTATWYDAPKPPVHRLPDVSLAHVKEASRYPTKRVYPDDVTLVQQALTAHGLYRGTPTGVYGHGTRDGVQAFQKRLGYVGGDADGILGTASATRLGANRYRLTP